MFKSQKNAFWQALIVALIMFNIGIFFGYMLERNRVQKIDVLYATSELEMLDVKAINSLISLSNLNCKSAIQENLAFANKIYDEAKLLDRYEVASRISDALILRHKKYDLLRIQLWINSIMIKEKCNSSLHNVVYLYEYGSGEIAIEQKAKQSAFSRFLGELKEKHGDSILLIPIAGDIDFGSIKMLRENYNITILPAVLIDEKFKIESIDELKDIEKYVK